MLDITDTDVQALKFRNATWRSPVPESREVAEEDALHRSGLPDMNLVSCAMCECPDASLVLKCGNRIILCQQHRQLYIRLHKKTRRRKYTKP